MTSISPPCHTRTKKTSDSWITPKHLIEKLGPFDLDPCAAIPQPWPCATRCLTVNDDGLSLPWAGFVWMNPPYGRALGLWLKKLAEHDNGIALVFARVETRAFFDAVWGKASCLLFLRGRITFAYPDGSFPRNGANSGGPSVLIGYGSEAAIRLRKNSELGAFVDLKSA